MNMNEEDLSLMPANSLQKVTRRPRTLVYSKGVPISKTLNIASTLGTEPLNSAVNQPLNRTIERRTVDSKSPLLPPYLSMDKKVLRFDGYFREDTSDWAQENYRIRPVKVLYYLQNDTMEVIEPKIPNCGLVQGTLFKRQVFPHPGGGGRKYKWKDLNLGIELKVFGLSIRLVDCDAWTKDYLIESGIELNNPEIIPLDPYQELRMNYAEHQKKEGESRRRSDGVLRFFGTWEDTLSDPPQIRRLVLQFYLVDGTLEILEDHAPNSGRDPHKVLVKRQIVPVDRNEIPANFPSIYMEIKDEDTACFTEEDLRTGKDLIILGKKIFLYDCDPFTRNYYKNHWGIEHMESVEVMEKPKPQSPKVIIPPHTGIGSSEDSFQNCLSLIPKAPKKNLMKELKFDGIALRFKAQLLTPFKDDEIRKFVLAFYPSDDTVSINEEPTTGFPGGAFLKRQKLGLAGTDCYSAGDFCFGAELKLAGRLFRLTHADQFVSTFMEKNPELYSEEQMHNHKRQTEKTKSKIDQ